MFDLHIVDFSHAELILDLVHRSFTAQAEQLAMTRDSNPHHGAFETLEDLRRRMDGGERVVLAYLDGRAVGTVRFRQLPEKLEEGHIARLAVLPEYRGRQFGGRLMEFAERELRAVGVETAVLGIIGIFTRLQKFYESLGYEVFESFTPEHRLFEVLLMRKSLK